MGIGIKGAKDQLLQQVANDQYNSPQAQLLRDQKAQQDLEKAQKKNTEDLNEALKFQKQFAATAQGKNGTLLTSPASNRAAPVPQPGQKTLLGQ